MPDVQTNQEYLDEDGLRELWEGTLKAIDTRSAVTDDTDGPIYSATARGWAEQLTTTGKNFWVPISDFISVNGVTISPNVDGSFTLNGTSTATSTPTVMRATTFPAGTYTMSGCPAGGGSQTYRLGVKVNNESLGNDSGDGYTFTIEQVSTLSMTLRIASDVTFNNLTFYPQLEAGSKATEYEPFTGYAPSPSPEFPQEIRVARGRNLLPSIEQGGVGTSGDLAAVNRCRTPNNARIPVTAGSTYVLSGSTAVGFNAINWYVHFFADTTTNTRLVNDSWHSANATVTAPSGATYARIELRAENDEEVTPSAFVNVQLELGSTPTPYVPYGHVGLEVQGRNLWGGSTFEQAIVAAGGTSSNGLVSITAGNAAGKQYCKGPFKENTRYTLILSSYNSSSRSNMDVVYTDGTSDLVPNPTTTKSTTVFTTAASKTVLLIEGRNSSGTIYYYPDECGLFEGVLTADDFEPYYHETTPIPLPLKSDGERWAGGLPDGTADALSVDSAGKYRWINKAAEKTLVGNDLAANSSSEAYTNPGVLDSNKNCAVGFCSHAPVLTTFNTTDMHCRLGYNNSRVYLIKFPQLTEAESLQDAKDWVDANPVTVLYPLATPTTESGYIPDWPVDIPEGSVITCPELTEVGVRCFLPAAKDLIDHATNVYKRIESELDDIREAIADL